MTQAKAEARELSRIAAEELPSMPRGIRDVHGAIAGRVFAALGPSAAPVRRAHDAVSRGVYEGVRGGLWLTAHTAGAAARARLPLLEGATHCFVAATVTRSEKHPVGRLLGDTLVLAPSASGRSRARRIGFETENGLTLGGTHHLALLNHPEVYEQLRAWLRA